MSLANRPSVSLRPAPSILGRLGAGCLIAAVTLGAALAFLLQPMAGALVLPQFADPAKGWQQVNLLFQAASCLGFLAAWIASCFQQRRTGIALLCISWAAVFPARLFFWSGPFEWLTAYLAPLCLAAFALSTAQVLLPYWFGRAPMPVWVDPYFVFAFVSLGAIVGTLTYPLAIEPWFTRREQALGVALVMTVLGVLWVISLVVLEMAGGATIAPKVSADAPPTLGRRLRWVALAALPATLALLPFPRAVLEEQGEVSFVPVTLYQLTLVVAFARGPLSRPTPLSWVVQLLAIATSAVLMVVLGELHGGDVPMIGLALIMAPALVPHRWTFRIQAVLTLCALVLAWGMGPPMLLFLLFGALCSAGCWGCHGDLLADRPGSERLPQFLFFTGIAASLLAAFAVQLCAAFPLWAAYAFVVLLALAARFLPREHGDKRIAVESEGDLAGEAAPHAETSTGVFEKDRRVRGSGSGGP